MQNKETKGLPCPQTDMGNKSDGKPRLRKAGGGRPRKRAGSFRLAFFASVDALAVAEIHRRASLAGQTVNDYLSGLFDPAMIASVAPKGDSLANSGL